MISHLIHKEFLQIRRNAFLPRLIVLFPIVIMCVMPWVMQMEVKNVVVEVVDIDHTVASQRLIQQIAASNYFIFGGQRASYTEAATAAISSLPMPSTAPKEASAAPISVKS